MLFMLFMLFMLSMLFEEGSSFLKDCPLVFIRDKDRLRKVVLRNSDSSSDSVHSLVTVSDSSR